MRLREFEITSTLGEGGFSIVYAADDLQLKRGVAIKEYIPTSLAGRDTSSTVRLRSEQNRDTFDAGLHGFINESRLLAQFKHPALVEVLQFWEENETAYMVMPHYHGKTLRWVLRNLGKRCDERWLRGIIAPVLDVLEMLHANNVFHRDIAPDNILIKSDGTPVLLDLGSAREIVTGLQKVITVVVKPGYAPIEQYSSDFSLPQGPWTDIYAIGALLHFAVTGSAPPASISRIMKDNLKPLADEPSTEFSREFLAAIDHALALQPGARPQSIADLRKELRITDADRTIVALDSEQFANADATDTSIDEDDELTVIVSAEEIAEVVQQLLGHIARTDATPVAEAIAAPPPATIDNPLAAHVESAIVPMLSSFPEMEDLLAGRNGADARPVSVPTMHHPEHADSTSVQVTRSRAWQVPVMALAAIAVVTGIAFVTMSQSGSDVATEARTSVAAAGLAPPAIEAEPADAPPSPADVAVGQDIAAGAESTAMDSAAAVAMSDLGIPMLQPTDAQTPTQGEAWLPHFGSVPDGVTAVTDATPTPDTMSAEPAESAALATSMSALPATQKDDELVRDKEADNTVNREKTRGKDVTQTTSVALATNTHLNVQPWGEVWIDGKRRGISPPLRGLAMPAGSYSVELRSPGFAPYKRQITIKAGESITIEHRFALDAEGDK